jgi:hypothetical protein
LKLASGTRLLSLVPSHHNHAIGERIGIRLAIDHVVAFPVAQSLERHDGPDRLSRVHEVEARR